MAKTCGALALSKPEIRRAAELRRMGITWVIISARLGRDRVGLARAIKKYESASQ